MEFKIIAPGSDNLEIVHALPSHYTGKLFPLASVTTARAHFGNLHFQHYAGEGFDIWFSNYQINCAATLVGRADVQMLELRIHMLNPAQTNWNNTGDNVVMPYQYNLSFTPFMDSKSKFENSRTYETFDIHFKISYLEKLSPHFPVLDKFLSKVIKGQPAEISKLDRYLSPEMIQIVNALLNCPYKNGVAAFFIEAKVIELLLMVLQECSEENPLGATKLTSYDKEMLHSMKSYVEKEFEHPLTLKELSKKFTINEYKLKKGFKFLFGTTVFDYMNSIRMNKAHQMISETELTIGEIADLAGFEDRAAFDKAFKKHFGYTAAYLRKHKR